MRNKEQNDFLGYLMLVIGLGILMTASTGCAGLELGGRLGVYRVDERQESQATRRNDKPAICYLFPSRCNASTETEVQGS